MNLVRPKFDKLGARLARSLVRVALIGGLVWVGWTTAVSLSEVISGPRPPAPLPASPPQVAQPPLLETLSLRTRGGYWTFAGAPLRLQLAPLSEEQAAARLRRPPPDRPSKGGAEFDKPLLALLRSMNVPRLPAGRNGLYVVSQPGLKLVVFTRGVGPAERLLVGRLAFRADEGWGLIETGPGLADRAPAAAEGPATLPMPPGAVRLCDRRDDQDRLVAEVVSVSSTWSHLKTLWRDQGWSIEPGIADAEVCCFCRRGDESVHVWASPGTSGRTSLVLIREAHAQGGQ